MVLCLGGVRVWGEPVKVLSTGPGTQRCQGAAIRKGAGPTREGKVQRTEVALQKHVIA